MKHFKKYESTKNLLEKKLRDWKPIKLTSSNDEMEDDSADDPSPATPPAPPKLSFTEQLKQKVSSSSGNSGSAVYHQLDSEMDKEISTFENLPDTEEGEDILSWWKVNGSYLPRLDSLARVVYSVQAASSKSERVFSVARKVVEHRTRLTPEKLEQLVQIKANLKNLRSMGLFRK